MVPLNLNTVHNTIFSNTIHVLKMPTLHLEDMNCQESSSQQPLIGFSATWHIVTR
jgi:hypothetical protein